MQNQDIRRWLPAALLGAALSLGTAQAAASKGSPGAAGAGTERCAAITKQLAASPGLMGQTYFPWAQGYMSGVNGVFIANAHAYRELAADPAGQQKFIMDYCAKHPSATLLDAVIALYQSRPLAQ